MRWSGPGTDGQSGDAGVMETKTKSLKGGQSTEPPDNKVCRGVGGREALQQ